MSKTTEIFQPSLHLAVEPDGEYTLNVVTVTPNSAYSAGRARRGAPPNVRLTAETFPVTLNLHARGGKSLQVLTPVRHHLRNLKLGPKHGKSTLLVFVTLDGHVVGTSSIAVGATHECPTKDPASIDTTGWYAWLNRMPPGPASFHITGVVLLPTPGYDVRLVPAVPQGINPKDLILDLEVTPRPGYWPEVVTRVSVRYDQSPTGVEYTSVLVREPDGDAVQVPVEEVR
jgi:hypothetical protein